MDDSIKKAANAGQLIEFQPTSAVPAHLLNNGVPLTKMEQSLAGCTTKAGSIVNFATQDAVSIITAPETQPNNVFQLNIDNTGSGHRAVKMRIGGLHAVSGAGVMYGLPTYAAADATLAALCTDDFDSTKGVTFGCNKSQQLTQLSLVQPLIVTEIRIISSTPGQLSAGLKVLELMDDLTVVPRIVDLVGDQNMDDTRSTLIVIRPKIGLGWMLSPTKGLEFAVLDNVTLSITLRISAHAGVGQFIQLG